MKRYTYYIIFLLAFTLVACERERTVYVDFDTVEGLYKGAKLTRQGIVIGEVNGIKRGENGKVRVTCGVKCKKLFSETTEFRLKPTDFLGTKAIDVVAGSGPPAKADFVFTGIAAPAEGGHRIAELTADDIKGFFVKQDSILNELKDLKQRLEALEKK